MTLPDRCKYHIQFIIICIVLLTGCPAEHGKICKQNGTQYGKLDYIFTSQWFEYYERALSYMEGDCYEYAIEDFDRAIIRKDIDSWWKNTYGNHFITYFPHREKGISLYYIHKCDLAVNELKQSIHNEPTAKAYFFLDKARQCVMNEQDCATSVPEVSLNIDNALFYQNDMYYVKDDPVIVSGIAEDKHFISMIKIENEQIYLDVSKIKVTFAKKIYPDQGKQYIDILVKNLQSIEKEYALKLNVDRQGPVISITEYIPGRIIRGSISDQSIIISCKLNNRIIPVTRKTYSPFSIQLNDTDSNCILAVEDALHNTTQFKLSDHPMIRNKKFSYTANNDYGEFSDTFALGMRLNKRIFLKGWPDYKKVYTNKISIDGQIDMQYPIESLIIQIKGDNAIQEVNICSDTEKYGKTIIFNQFLKLYQGINNITFTAIDKTRNTLRKTIQIHCLVSTPYAINNRYALKVFPFDSDINLIKTEIAHYIPLNNFSSVMTDGNRNFFQHYFFSQLVNQSRFQLKPVIENIFQEVNDDKEKMNKKLFCHASLLGGTNEDHKGIEVSIRLIDNQTSEILFIHQENKKKRAILDVYTDTKNKQCLREVAKRLSNKLDRAFPLLEGNILKVQGDHKTFILKIINDQMIEYETIHLGWPILIYREKEKLYNPVTGRFLGTNHAIVGYGVIDGYMKRKEMYYGTLEQGTYHISDRIITQ